MAPWRANQARLYCDSRKSQVELGEPVPYLANAYLFTAFLDYSREIERQQESHKSDKHILDILTTDAAFMAFISVKRSCPNQQP